MPAFPPHVLQHPAFGGAPYPHAMPMRLAAGGPAGPPHAAGAHAPPLGPANPAAAAHAFLQQQAFVQPAPPDPFAMQQLSQHVMPAPPGASVLPPGAGSERPMLLLGGQAYVQDASGSFVPVPTQAATQWAAASGAAFNGSPGFPAAPTVAAPYSPHQAAPFGASPPFYAGAGWEDAADAGKAGRRAGAHSATQPSRCACPPAPNLPFLRLNPKTQSPAWLRLRRCACWEPTRCRTRCARCSPPSGTRCPPATATPPPSARCWAACCSAGWPSRRLGCSGRAWSTC